MNESDRIIYPTVQFERFDQSMHRYGILEFSYCALSYSRQYFHVLKYIALCWYFLGILLLWIILVKTVFSCLDWILSWSRGYFHVLIRMVFSYMIHIESTEDLQQDLNCTWPLFGQVKLLMMILWSNHLIIYCNRLYLFYSDQTRWIVCHWVEYFLWSTSDLQCFWYCSFDIRLWIDWAWLEFYVIENLNWFWIQMYVLIMYEQSDELCWPRSFLDLFLAYNDR